MGHLPHVSSNRSEAPRRLIGKLCVGGDWACANGDLEALGDVAVQLAGYAHEPLHCELVALSELCHSDPERASATWMRLKPEVLRDVAPS
ncbi:MAG TPA: hypothetical protein VFK02_33205 [Kofleriaceae bacterium]|nr:hypothetical protein [Kofleriaceae bacterium]